MLKKSWRVYYRSYKAKGGGKFLWKNLSKLLILMLLFLGIVSLIEYLLPDTVKSIDERISQYPDHIIYLIFFLSESILGLIPPDLFILWAQKLDLPYLGVTFLAFLSYAGGLVSYQIGIRLSHLRILEDWLERQLVKHVGLIKQWGSFLIVIAALFPLPFSPICIAAGSVRFPIKHFLVFSAFRIVRFYIYAVILFRLF
ncbi:MAG: hypothetical protein CMP59_05515 [Flavobacteriales bacterium]|nr:hypothetical protein [Flavobacteriales bacterium]